MPRKPKLWKKRWKLVVAYDGTDYHGWQVQPDKQTIQGVLGQALTSITGERVLPQGSGRTDAGVHAEGQVCSVGLYAEIPEENLLRAVNRILPGSIRLLSAQKMPPKFHARSLVISKTYRYRIFLRRPYEDQTENICPPWRARFVWECPYRLNVEDMQRAASFVVGAHDFTSFAAYDPDRARRMRGEGVEGGDAMPSNVRTITESRWQREGDELTYTVSGNGFLHHMVRNLVGTFVEAGTGRIAVDDVPKILAAKDRTKAGVTAQPQGLSLVRVVYEGDGE